MNFSWQINQPFDAIVFDCDGTLSQIEGIDELAVQNGVGDLVKSLTAKAMASTGITDGLYQERLSLVKPHRDQVVALGTAYFKERIPDVDRVIDVLQQLGKAVFILSAGLKLSVDLFAQLLKIPVPHVYAVDIDFDARGNYQDFDRQSPLVRSGGKGELVQQLKSQYPTIMYVGDGANDLDAKPHVARFVGYGGITFRESILAHSDFYIQSLSLASLLALALTQEEASHLSEEDRVIYDKGLALIQDGEIILL